MNILLILSNKKFLSLQHSDGQSISIRNQGSINEKMINNELTTSYQIVKGGEEINSVKKHLPTFEVENPKTDLYILPLFDSRLPPSQSIIRNKSGICWLIALIECFKSNEELLKYVFNTVKNEEFLKALENVLQIHDEEISEKDFDSLLSIYTDEKPNRSDGSNAVIFILNLMKFCSSQETEEQKNIPFFHIPVKLEESDDRVDFIPTQGIPFIQICIPEAFHEIDYLKIDKFFLPSVSPLSSLDDHSDYIILNRQANFIIVNVHHSISHDDDCKDFKGMVIPKTLFITTLYKQKRKYSLTSILYYQKANSEDFDHEAAYVKRNNEWFNSECELDKDKMGIDSDSVLKESSILVALNDKNIQKVIFDTAEHKNNFSINTLFYQIEE